jgi:RNA polymerase sigma-70 factor (ECF subfamily)
VHDAQDLTQSFFAYLIEHKIYTRVDPQKGKFRSFLLASLKNLLADAHDREQTLKRGGGQDFLPLNEEQVEEAESLFQTHCASEDSPNEDRLFERTWAERQLEEWARSGRVVAVRPAADCRCLPVGAALNSAPTVRTAFSPAIG